MNADDPPPISPDGHAHEAAPVRIAPLALWRVAQAFLHTLHALFGGPDRIALRHTLTAKAHGQLASWLRCAEAMLRRLILIEAGAYPKPNTRPLLRAQRLRARRPVLFYPDKPEDWRVSFRCFTSPTLRQPRIKSGGDAVGDATVSVSVSLSLSKAKRPRISREDRWCSENWKPVKFRSAWPLALRYQALIRVFNDPSAYARRLSARLHATPHRLREMLRAPPEARDRVDHFDALSEHAETAWRPHFSSA